MFIRTLSSKHDDCHTSSYKHSKHRTGDLGNTCTITACFEKNLYLTVFFIPFFHISSYRLIIKDYSCTFSMVSRISLRGLQTEQRRWLPDTPKRISSTAPVAKMSGEFSPIKYLPRSDTFTKHIFGEVVLLHSGEVILVFVITLSAIEAKPSPSPS